MPAERHRTRTETGTSETSADPREPLPLLRRELGTGDRGLSGREAARRLAVYGPNQVRRRAKRSLTRLLTAQLAHPLALLLWGAGALAFISGTPALGWAILAVILVNAGFALLQEHQAERAVEALAAYLPERTHVIRDGRKQSVEAAGVVPGDLIVLAEGDKVPADARLGARRPAPRDLPVRRAAEADVHRRPARRPPPRLRQRRTRGRPGPHVRRRPRRRHGRRRRTRAPGPAGPRRRRPRPALRRRRAGEPEGGRGRAPRHRPGGPVRPAAPAGRRRGPPLPRRGTAHPHRDRRQRRHGRRRRRRGGHRRPPHARGRR